MPIAFTTSTRMVSVLAGIIGDACCLPSQWQALLLRIFKFLCLRAKIQRLIVCAMRRPSVDQTDVVRTGQGCPYLAKKQVLLHTIAAVA
jgi:hypothetical protein